MTIYGWHDNKLTAKALKEFYKVVSITVNSGQSSGSSSADPELVGGTIIGYHPAGNQDQHVDNIAVGSTGAVTVTLAANATANNSFKVIVLKP